MTLMTLTTVRRLYAEQNPEWQRFQTTLTTATASSSSINSNTTQLYPYQRQYSHVYHQRLSMLGPIIWKRIRSYCNTVGNTENDTTINHTARILELPEDTLCSCVGTLIVERDLTVQPTEDDNIDLITVTTPSSKDNNCTFYLEDESGRVALNFSLWWTAQQLQLQQQRDHMIHDTTADDDNDIHSLGGSSQNDTPTDLCTGVVIGIVGVVGVDGIMQVEKVYTAATVLSTTKNTMMLGPSIDDDSTLNGTNTAPYVLLLSGLDCGSPTASSMSRDMLISYLQGAFPHRDSKAASIAHVIIAGGLICDGSGTDTTTMSLEERTMITSNGCRDLDIFCYQISQVTGIPISIIPGANDPTTANWPQRPLHASLIPVSTKSSNSTAVRSRCPNPYAATFHVEHETKRHVLGTDGTNVIDWMKQSKRNRPVCINGIGDSCITELDALHATLAHQHMCPTGPDTVPTVPHIEIDPMVMTMYNHNSNKENTDGTNTSTNPTIYFAGNCTQFQTKLVTMNNVLDEETSSTSNNNITIPKCCRLVCIPKFNESSIAVLVNLITLQTELLKFDTTNA